MLGRGSGSGQDRQGDVLEFGRERRPGRRWRSRVLLAGLVLIAALVAGVRGVGHLARTESGAASRLPAVSVIPVGHRLLGVRAGWQLFARGPDDLLRIQFAEGRITRTYVPPLETSSRAVAFMVAAHETVIRPADLVPGYVVPDGGRARLLTGAFGEGRALG